MVRTGHQVKWRRSVSRATGVCVSQELETVNVPFDGFAIEMVDGSRYPRLRNDPTPAREEYIMWIERKALSSRASLTFARSAAGCAGSNPVDGVAVKLRTTGGLESGARVRFTQRTSPEAGGTEAWERGKPVSSDWTVCGAATVERS